MPLFCFEQRYESQFKHELIGGVTQTATIDVTQTCVCGVSHTIYRLIGENIVRVVTIFCYPC